MLSFVTFISILRRLLDLYSESADLVVACFHVLLLSHSLFFSFKRLLLLYFFFFFQAEDGIRDWSVTGVQTCALPISIPAARRRAGSTVTSAAAASTSSTRAATCSRSSRDPMETMRAAAGDGAAYNGPLAIVGGKKGENHEKARYRNNSCSCAGVFGFPGGRRDRAGQESGQRRCAADHQGRRGKRQAGCDRDHLRAGRRKQHVQGGDSRRARPGGRHAAAHLRRRQEGTHRLQDRAGENQRAGSRI